MSGPFQSRGFRGVIWMTLLLFPSGGCLSQLIVLCCPDSDQILISLV